MLTVAVATPSFAPVPPWSTAIPEADRASGPLLTSQPPEDLKVSASTNTSLARARLAKDRSSRRKKRERAVIRLIRCQHDCLVTLCVTPPILVDRRRKA